MPFDPVQGKAAGTIPISTFVKLNAAANQQFLSCGAGDRPIGISTEAAHDAPIPSVTARTTAAVSGDQFKYYPIGSICRLLAGSGGWTANDMLISDAGGAGVTVASSTAAQFVGAIALETVAAGEYGLVQSVLMAYTGT
jgi:hypothetical protein